MVKFTHVIDFAIEGHIIIVLRYSYWLQDILSCFKHILKKVGLYEALWASSSIEK